MKTHYAEDEIPSPIFAKRSDFSREKTAFSGGHFSQVFRVEYLGNNESIQSLSTATLVEKEIKSASRAHKLDNDVIIAPYLYHKGRNNPALGEKYNSGLVVLMEGEAEVKIISRLIAYDTGPPAVASSLEGYLSKFHANKTADATLPGFEDTHIGVTLSQFVASMKEAQNAMHEVGLLHLDTSARNFLMNPPTINTVGGIHFSLTITDFGYSEFIPRNGVVNFTHEIAPLRYLDRRAIERREFTIATDLYALKAAMFETIGMALGKTTEDILTFLPNQDATSYALMKYQKHATDAETLVIFMQNVRVALQDVKDEKMQEQIKIFLDAYEPYLTSMPEQCHLQGNYGNYTAEEIIAIREADYREFAAATEMYQRIMHERMLNTSSEREVIPRIPDARTPAINMPDAGELERISMHALKTKTEIEETHKAHADEVKASAQYTLITTPDTFEGEKEKASSNKGKEKQGSRQNKSSTAGMKQFFSEKNAEKSADIKRTKYPSEKQKMQKVKKTKRKKKIKERSAGEIRQDLFAIKLITGNEKFWRKNASRKTRGDIKRIRKILKKINLAEMRNKNALENLWSKLDSLSERGLKHDQQKSGAATGLFTAIHNKNKDKNLDAILATSREATEIKMDDAIKLKI